MNFVYNKLLEVRNSEPAVKKRWLVFLSGVSMIVVVLLWIGYVSTTSSFVGEETPKRPKNRFLTIMKRGFNEVMLNTGDTVNNAASGFLSVVESATRRAKKTRDLDIEGKKENLIVGDDSVMFR